MSELQDLKNKIFREPSTKVNRPYLVKYIKLRTEAATQLTKEERLAEQGEGWNIAGDILIAVAWQSADGIKHDNWLTKETEPILDAIENATSSLDVDGSHPEKWSELFELVRKLK
jgi:hypothetical protein